MSNFNKYYTTKPIPKSILFRADSSSIIGTGHIMRDLVLAKEFDGAKISFAVQELPGNINHKIAQEGYGIHLLHSNDAVELIDLIMQNNIEMIVIDHYGIDSLFEQELKAATGVEIFVLDDTYEKHHCDTLLNHNIYADATKYQGLVPESCELRCGANYTLLREEFHMEKQKGRVNRNDPQNYRVFIAMGGADHRNLNGAILDVLQQFPTIYADVVTTTANQNLEALQAYVKENEHIKLHINTDRIAQLMNEVDLAIVTPSVTLNEIVFLDIPFIAIQTAENQKFMVEYILQKYPQNMIDHFDGALLREKVEVRLRCLN